MSTKMCMAINVIRFDDIATQCRVEMLQEVIDDYAECMKRGDKFPPIDVVGTPRICWIGDGWYRLRAAQKIGRHEIEVILHPGKRTDAIKFALGANASHGLRRTNADKRKAIEVALREFPDLSSRAIADLCGVDHKTVEKARPTPQVGKIPNSKPAPQKPRTGKDGKKYKAPQATKKKEESKNKKRASGPCMGMDKADIAIMHLEEIVPNDTERQQAFNHVEEWIANARGDKGQKKNPKDARISMISPHGEMKMFDWKEVSLKANDKNNTKELFYVLQCCAFVTENTSPRRLISMCSEDDVRFWAKMGQKTIKTIHSFFDALLKAHKEKTKPPKKKGG